MLASSAAKRRQVSTFPRRKRGFAAVSDDTIQFLFVQYIASATTDDKTLTQYSHLGPGKPVPVYTKPPEDKTSTLPPENSKSLALWFALLYINSLGKSAPAFTDGAQPCGPAGSNQKRKKSKGKGREATKRPRRDNDGDDDQAGSDNGGEGSHQDPFDCGKTCNRFMACPYYKLDPEKYARCLGKYELRRPFDVRQHMLRCHTLGQYYCTTCWQLWPKKEPWQAHHRDRNCQRILGPEQLDHAEENQLRSFEAPRGLDDRAKWYMMWDAFFGQHPRPPSPYVDDIITDAGSFHRHNGGAAMMTDLPFLLQQYFPSLPQQQDAIMMQFGAALLYSIFDTGNPRPRRYRLYPDENQSHMANNDNDNNDNNNNDNNNNNQLLQGGDGRPSMDNPPATNASAEQQLQGTYDMSELDPLSMSNGQFVAHPSFLPDAIDQDQQTQSMDNSVGYLSAMLPIYEETDTNPCVAQVPPHQDDWVEDSFPSSQFDGDDDLGSGQIDTALLTTMIHSFNEESHAFPPGPLHPSNEYDTSGNGDD